MRYLPKILGTLLFGICCVILLSYIAGSILISPAHTTIQETPEGLEAITLESRNGRISGWLATVENPRGALLLLHGVRSNKSTMVQRIQLAKSLDFHALAIDLQAHGESDGSAITFGHRESFDAQEAVEYLKTRFQLPIFVVGVSLGGAAAVLAKPPLKVDGLVLEAVYPDISSAISNRIEMRIPFGSLLTPLLSLQLRPRLGLSPNQLSPALSARNMDTPVLILNGSVDEHTTPQDARNLFQEFGGEKQLEFIEGASHVDLHRFDKQHYTLLVSGFFEKNLSTRLNKVLDTKETSIEPYAGR